MSTSETPRLAVVGLGEIGRGWAALAAAHGWQVAIYDPDTATLHDAAEAIAARAKRLVDHGAADRALAANALAGLRVGRSLLHAVGDADWIVEAGADELHHRQHVLERIEQAARLAAILTSSTGGLHASALCGRLRRPHRFLAIHPIEPVELQPVVEVIPGPLTDPGVAEDVRFWLVRLRREAFVLRREVPGNVTGRLTAAVWRECIQLVLDGVLDVEEVDRLVARGPATGWMAAGPHLSQFLAAGDTPAVGLQKLLQDQEEWLGSLAAWHRLDPEAQGRLIKLLVRAYGADRDARLAARNERLGRLTLESGGAA